jgi:hypothetical protein
MLAIAVQTKKSPVQIFGLIGLLSLALGGYLLFSSMHVAKAQDFESIVRNESTLSEDSFLMFMHPEHSAVHFLTSHSFTGHNFKFRTNNNRNFAFYDSNRYEKPF